jgi:hypothetical protein
MQRMEVSGAVRPLKWPLGVKWLNFSGCPLFARSIQQNLDYYPKLRHGSSLPLLELFIYCSLFVAVAAVNDIVVKLQINKK